MATTKTRPAPTVDEFRTFTSHQIDIAARHSKGGWGRNPFWIGWLQAFGQCIDWLDGKKVEGDPMPAKFLILRDTIAREGDVRYRVVEKGGAFFVRREVMRWARTEDTAFESEEAARAALTEWEWTGESSPALPAGEGTTDA